MTDRKRPRPNRRKGHTYANPKTLIDPSEQEQRALARSFGLSQRATEEPKP
jgi:hypothetical protein